MEEKPKKERISVTVNPAVASGISGYRLKDRTGKEIKQVNNYLDTLAVRGLSGKTIATYAYYLLDFWRWKTRKKIRLKDVTKNTLLDYVQYQQQTANPAPVTINNRLTVIGCLYQHYFNRYIPNRSYRTEEEIHSSVQYRVGWMYPRHTRKLSLKVKVPHTIIVPLTVAEVVQFFKTLKMWRDISIVGFMLFCGLRRKEVIGLKLKDLSVAEGQARVHGKGNRERMVPVPGDLLVVVRKYLDLERPENDNDYLFVVLKGPKRGNPITESGIRSLFRYHRGTSRICNANPHRFRHTFGAEMVKAGLSLAVLKKLMGHAYIQTTMEYVNISDPDVRAEFNKITEKLQTKELLNGPTMESVS